MLKSSWRCSTMESKTAVIGKMPTPNCYKMHYTFAIRWH